MNERAAWAIVAAACLMLVLLEAPLLNMDRGLEPDELIFKTLAGRLAEQPARYDLQGTRVLNYISREVYDRPLFFHPPLFAWLLRWTGFNMVLPLACQVLTLLLTFWMGRRLGDLETGVWAALFYACCPVAFWCATHVWMDDLLLLCTTLGVAAMLLAVEHEPPAWMLLPGIALGLASLSRLNGFIALLPMLAVYLRRGRRPSARAVAAFVLPPLLMMTPWLVEMFHVYGTHVVDVMRIPASELDRFPFMRLARHRPFWFYPAALVLVAPLHLISFAALARVRWDIAAWPLSILLALTVYGVGNTFQLRFIAPAMPGFCLAAALFLMRLPRTYRIAALAFGLFGLFNGWYCGVLHRAWGLGDVGAWWQVSEHGNSF
ncbi:MAG: ArnT family glycosyltransferase [Candidatus Xenobia bacterium]